MGLRTATLAAAALLLAGCGSTKGGGDAVQCPAAGILDRSGAMTKFRTEDGSRDPTDVVWEARITDVAAACRTDRRGYGVVDLRIGLQVVRGPAATEGELPLTYFVAIVGPNDEVLSREAFRTDFRVPADRSGANTTEELTLRIPRPDAAPLSAYRIYAALQLTPGELEYNRERYGR